MNQSHILVVEDERDIAVAIEAYLSNQGYKVSIAGNGIEALEIVESTIAEIILQLAGKGDYIYNEIKRKLSLPSHYVIC